MGLLKTLLVLAVIYCLLAETESWWSRRRRRSSRRRRSWLRAVGRAFRTVGRAIVRVAKIVVKYVKKGIDILKHGCCGLHPSYCANRKEFQRRQREIKTKSVIIDRDYAYVKKMKKLVEDGNTLNQNIYRNVRRVTLSSTLNVQTLDPRIITKMNSVANELKKQVKAKNRTVLQYGINEIGKEFEKTEGDTKNNLQDLSNTGGLGMAGLMVSMTADMFKLLKLDGVANFLVGEVGGFLLKIQAGISKLFGFDYLKKLLSGSAAGRAVLKVLDFFDKYLSISAGITRIFKFFGKLVAWITDLAACNKNKKDMEVKLRDIKIRHAEINKSYNDLQVQKKRVDSSWATVFGQAKGDGLLTNLLEIQKIAQHASGSSAQMRTSQTKIANYRANVKSSTSEGVVRMQRELLNAVKSVTYNSECYQRKLQVFQAVSQACKLGRDTMENLYKEAIVDFRANSEICKSQTRLPYTSLADVKKFVKVQANRLQFETDCLMNSGIKRTLVCNLLQQGYTLAYSIQEADVSEEIGRLYRSECPIPEISPREKESICFMKEFRSENEIIGTFLYHQPINVKKVYKQCAKLFPQAA